jgi:hypothetical protein
MELPARGSLHHPSENNSFHSMNSPFRENSLNDVEESPRPDASVRIDSTEEFLIDGDDDGESDIGTVRSSMFDVRERPIFNVVDPTVQAQLDEWGHLLLISGAGEKIPFANHEIFGDITKKHLCASIWILDAIHARAIDYPRNDDELVKLKRVRSSTLRMMFNIASMYQIFAPFLNKPVCAYTSSKSELTYSGWTWFSNGGAPTITALATFDIACLMIFAYDLYLSFGVNPSRKSFFSKPWTFFRLIATICLFGAIIATFAGLYDAQLYLRCLFPFIMISRRNNLKLMLQGLLHSAYYTLNVVVALTCIIILWGSIGFFLFRNIEIEGNHFTSLSSGIFTALHCFTARGYSLRVLNEIYPTQIMAALWFVTLTISADILCTALIIATGWRQYKEFAAKIIMKRLLDRKKAVYCAFLGFATEHGGFSLKDWKLLCSEIKDPRYELTEENAEHIFAMENVESDGYVDIEGFVRCIGCVASRIDFKKQLGNDEDEESESEPGFRPSLQSAATLHRVIEETNENDDSKKRSDSPVVVQEDTSDSDQFMGTFGATSNNINNGTNKNDTNTDSKSTSNPIHGENHMSPHTPISISTVPTPISNRNTNTSSKQILVVDTKKASRMRAASIDENRLPSIKKTTRTPSMASDAPPTFITPDLGPGLTRGRLDSSASDLSIASGATTSEIKIKARGHLHHEEDDILRMQHMFPDLDQHLHNMTDEAHNDLDEEIEHWMDELNGYIGDTFVALFTWFLKAFHAIFQFSVIFSFPKYNIFQACIDSLTFGPQLSNDSIDDKRVNDQETFTYYSIPLYDSVYMFVLHVTLLIQLSYVSDPQSSYAWHALGWWLQCLFLLDFFMKYLIYGYQGVGRTKLARIGAVFINIATTISMVILIVDRNGLYGSANINTNTTLAMTIDIILQSCRFFKLFFLICDQSVFEDIFPTLFRALFILFSVIYFFSVFAHTFFCSSLIVGDATLDADDDSPAWDQVSHLLNFDTILQSLFTMFEMAVLSNWSIVMDAAEKVAGIRAYFFFYTYRLVVSIFTMPLLISFIMQSFVSAINKKDKKNEMDKATNLKDNEQLRTLRKAVNMDFDQENTGIEVEKQALEHFASQKGTPVDKDVFEYHGDISRSRAGTVVSEQGVPSGTTSFTNSVGSIASSTKSEKYEADSNPVSDKRASVSQSRNSTGNGLLTRMLKAMPGISFKQHKESHYFVSGDNTSNTEGPSMLNLWAGQSGNPVKNMAAEQERGMSMGERDNDVDARLSTTSVQLRRASGGNSMSGASFSAAMGAGRDSESYSNSLVNAQKYGGEEEKEIRELRAELNKLRASSKHNSVKEEK